MKQKLSILLAVLLLFTLTACSSNEKASPSPNNSPSPGATNDAQGNTSKPLFTGDSSEMVNQLRSQYAGVEEYTYTEPLYNLPRDFQFVLNGELFKQEGWLVGRSMMDVVQIYSSSNFTSSTAMNFDYDYDTDAGTLVLSPYTPAFDLEEAITGFNFHTKSANDWGNASKYYLVSYIDFDTGETLDKPQAKLFTVKAELDAPQIEYRVDENGGGIFYWDAVPGATSYIIGTARTEDGEATGDWFEQVDVVTTNEWDRFAHSVTLYKDYMSWDDDVPDWYKNSVYVQNEDRNDSDSYVYEGYGFFVVAVKDGGNSNMSNIVCFEDFAPSTPYKPDSSRNFNYSGDDGSLVLRFGGETIWVPDVESAPLYQSVEMLDGSYKQFLINYPDSTADTEKYTDRYGETHDRIITSTHGTLFQNGIVIEDTGGRSMSDILKYLKEREQGAGKGGAPEVEAPVSDTPSVDTDFGNNDSEVMIDNDAGHLSAPEVEYELLDIYANSALSAYLALSFVNHNEEISLADFPEAADGAVLMDAIYEAWLQNNAYIGGIDVFNIGYDFSTRTLHVPYAYNAGEQKKLQSDINAKADQIIAQIITPGMSDYQKEEAINNYLCANGEYDWKALDKMMSDDENYVKEATRAAQTAYGILIDGMGICQSYAEAFKVLADKAGLQSVVASGVLNGLGGHAWNRVYIEGQWFTLDVTNNDSETTYNEFFNMPDEVAALFVTEDGQYVLNSVLYQYTSSDFGFDYFSQNGMSTTMQDLEDYLATNLGDGKNLDVVIVDIFDASSDDLVTAMQNAANRASVNFKPRIALWVLRIICE